jgi:hypothetical protein
MIKGGGSFSTVTCPLSVAGVGQGTGLCVLVQVLGTRAFHHGPMARIGAAGGSQELRLVLWHRCWETSLGGPISMGAKQL